MAKWNNLEQASYRAVWSARLMLLFLCSHINLKGIRIYNVTEIKKMSNRISGISRMIVAIVLVIVIVVAGVGVYVYYQSTLPKPTLTVYALWSGTEQYNFEQVL